MIVPEKTDTTYTPSSPQANGVFDPSPSRKAADTQSIMSQEPPPYSEAGPSFLPSSPPPVVRRSGGHSPQHSFQGRTHNSHNSHQTPGPDQRDVARAGPTSYPPPVPPRDRSQMQLAGSPQHRPPSTSSLSPLSPPTQSPWLSPPTDTDSSLRPDTERRCNYFSERKQSSSLKGTWNLDTGLHIPESLRPALTEFHGFWNEMDKKSVKAREKEHKKREGGGGWGRKKPAVDPAPLPKLANEGVRPNLMLASKDGGVQAEVNVSSSDGAMKMATIVAESNDGSVKLSVNAPAGLPLRIFAISMDGSVRVRIPPTFEGAIWMTTEDGSIHISESVKSRLMTFSLTNKTARCYAGDWQSTNFGHSTQSPSDSQEPEGPFKAWTGPLVHIYARDGSVHLAHMGEDTSSTFSKAMRSIYNGIVGTGNDEGDGRRPKDQMNYMLQHVRQDPRLSWAANTTAGTMRGYPPRMLSAPPTPGSGPAPAPRESNLFSENEQYGQQGHGHKK